jgi:hypothetical protein
LDRYFASKINDIGLGSDAGKKLFSLTGTFSDLADLIAGGRSTMTNRWSGREGQVLPQKAYRMLMKLRCVPAVVDHEVWTLSP